MTEKVMLAVLGMAAAEVAFAVILELIWGPR
jgi:hypothetical protein